MKEYYHADCFTCKRKLLIFNEIRMCSYCASPDWNKYFKIANKHESVKKILIFFDTQIVRIIDRDNRKTTDVRIRIVCGMINKNVFLTRDMKHELMELIWKKYKQRIELFNDFYARSILGLPF